MYIWNNSCSWTHDISNLKVYNQLQWRYNIAIFSLWKVFFMKRGGRPFLFLHSYFKDITVKTGFRISDLGEREANRHHWSVSESRGGCTERRDWSNEVRPLHPVAETDLDLLDLFFGDGQSDHRTAWAI